MKWQGREILPIRHRYNCQINDPVYPPPMGVIGRWLMKIHHLRHNVPVEDFRSSERAIEISLAIDFLSHYIKDEPVLELGCVLPYYILKRPNHAVCDLTDTHPQNIRRDLRKMSDDDFRANIVSISTIEHIGMNEYGIKGDGGASAVDVLKRILANALRYFITFPLGYNQALDEFIANAPDLNEKYVTRAADDLNDWVAVEKSRLTTGMTRYGTYLRANTVCVMMKV